MAEQKFKVDGGFESFGDGEINGTLDMSGFAVVNLGDPTEADGAATVDWIANEILTKIGDHPDPPA